MHGFLGSRFGFRLLKNAVVIINNNCTKATIVNNFDQQSCLGVPPLAWAVVDQVWWVWRPSVSGFWPYSAGPIQDPSYRYPYTVRPFAGYLPQSLTQLPECLCTLSIRFYIQISMGGNVFQSIKEFFNHEMRLFNECYGFLYRLMFGNEPMACTYKKSSK